MYKSEKQLYIYIHYLLGLLNTPNITTFQLNWIRTQNFQLKQLDIDVTLKYGQSHQKWYEQVKLSE